MYEYVELSRDIEWYIGIGWRLELQKIQVIFRGIKGLHADEHSVSG